VRREITHAFASPRNMARSRMSKNVGAARAAGAVPTMRVAAAAGDEVSRAIAALFRAHTQEYEALAGQAAQTPVIAATPDSCEVLRDGVRVSVSEDEMPPAGR
jgi:PE family